MCAETLLNVKSMLNVDKSENYGIVYIYQTI